jgi:hypothetical protein
MTDCGAGGMANDRSTFGETLRGNRLRLHDTRGLNGPGSLQNFTPFTLAYPRFRRVMGRRAAAHAVCMHSLSRSGDMPGRHIACNKVLVLQAFDALFNQRDYAAAPFW